MRMSLGRWLAFQVSSFLRMGNSRDARPSTVVNPSIGNAARFSPPTQSGSARILNLQQVQERISMPPVSPGT